MALAGNGVVRAGAAPALREFCRATGIAVAETFMGKGVLDYGRPASRSAPSGCSRATTRWPGFEDADVVIAIGYDLVEHAPKHWNPRRDKKIVVIDSEPAEIDEYFTPEVELVGDIYHVLTRLAEECRDVPHSAARAPAAPARGRPGPLRGRPRTTTHFPMQPPRVLWEIRQALGARGHADLGRRPAQAVDRPHVPRP